MREKRKVEFRRNNCRKNLAIFLDRYGRVAMRGLAKPFPYLPAGFSSLIPAGIAIYFRISRRKKCWPEQNLTHLHIISLRSTELTWEGMCKTTRGFAGETNRRNGEIFSRKKLFLGHACWRFQDDLQMGLVRDRTSLQRFHFGTHEGFGEPPPQIFGRILKYFLAILVSDL